MQKHSINELGGRVGFDPKLTKRNKYRTVLPYKYDNYKQFLNSTDWLKMRYKVLKRDDFECQYCHNKATQVHHLKYTTKAYHAEKLCNLIAVCSQCHKDKHTELYFNRKQLFQQFKQYEQEIRIELNELMKKFNKSMDKYYERQIYNIPY